MRDSDSAPVRRPALGHAALFRLARLTGLKRCDGPNGRSGRLLAGCFELIFGENEAADIAERLLPDRHLFQMVLPHSVRCGSRRAARERFSFDGDDFSFRIQPRVFLRGQKKRDLRSLLPEVASKFVGKKQSVIAAARRQYRESLIEPRPFRFQTALEPLPKLEAMNTSAKDSDAKQFCAGHGSFMERGGG